MAREVFIDASFWIALFYPRDDNYAESQAIWNVIRNNMWPAVTTNWTLYEALTHLNRSSLRRHDVAIRIFDTASRLSTVVHVEEAGLETLSLDIFRQHSDKLWSVVDCANFACIESRQSEFALSYDGNFEQAQGEFRFRLLKPQL